MFLKNDIVRYGAHGVCKIADIAEKNFNGVPVEYYALKPIYNDTSTIYVPLHNHRLSLSKKEYRFVKSVTIAFIDCLDNGRRIGTRSGRAGPSFSVRPEKEAKGAVSHGTSAAAI